MGLEMLTLRLASTLRFFARFCGESFKLTGLDAPKPSTSIRYKGILCLSFRYLATDLARSLERGILILSDPVLSVWPSILKLYSEAWVELIKIGRASCRERVYV